MDSQSPAATAGEQRRHVATMRGLLRRVWGAILRNKLLFATILVAAFAEAAFTKAPIVLVNELIGALATDKLRPVETTQTWWHEFRLLFETWLHHFVSGVGAWVQGFLGLVPPASDPARAATVVGCVALVICCAIPAGVAIYGVAVLSRYFATKIIVDLRSEVARHILSLPLRFFGGRRMGELLSNVTTDTAVLHRAFTLAADNMIEDPIQIVANIMILLLVVPETTWIVLLMIPAMAIPMIRMGRKVHRSSSKSLAAMGDSTESMNQMLSGIRTVKAFGLEDHRLDEFEQNNRRFLHRTKRLLQAKGLSEALSTFAYTVGFAALLGIMGWAVIQKVYTLANITTLMILLAATYSPVKRLSRAYNTLMESVGALDGIEEILLQPKDVAAATGGKVLKQFRGEVELRGVSFAYADEPVLRDLSFRIEPGQTVALVGLSGAGKSTTLDLLARFHDPDRGQVLIDGVDLREIDTRSYRTHIALVSQQPFVFNTTIRENILYGRPAATQAEIENAAKAAQIHDFILSLPNGYDSLAGERGCNLSGGQLQRLTIARAIVRDPALLFLDEATSSLDSESEQLVQKALENLMRGRTSFIIAHRLATTRNADVILVMEDGQVVEQGRHEQLIERGGRYARLCQLQQLA